MEELEDECRLTLGIPRGQHMYCLSMKGVDKV